MLLKIFKNKFFPVILLFLLTVPAFWFMLKPGIYWNMHDDMQLIRQMEMEKCLFDGQIPCRWTPDLGYGYGYPLFNFYPPFPYFVGQIFRTLGFSFVMTVKFTALVQIVLSSLFMYLLASSIFGPIGGFLSGLFYTYAPYHAVNVYIRGAMNEAWAAVFFPLILYFSRNLVKKFSWGSFFGLSFSFSFLMLSHNPMVLIFAPVALVWSLFWVYQEKASLKVIPQLALSLLLALGLSAFFTLPVLFETKFVQVDSMFTGYYTYAVHFVSIKQLFISNFWGDGPSVWGPNDGMSFAIGYLHWIIPMLITFIIGIRFLKNKSLTKLDQLVLLIILMSLFSAFLTHEKSTFIWKILSPIQKIQFPWRFLNITAFLTSLSIGYLPLLVKNKKVYTPINYFLFFLVTLVLFILNISHFTPVTSGPITDAQKFSGLAWNNQITSGIYDYLPKTASMAPLAPAKDYVDAVSPDTVKYSLTGQKKGTDWQFFNLTLDSSATVTLPMLGFPNFQIYDNNKVISSKIEPKLGRIVINLNSGNHQIYLKLRNTPIRSIANTITLISYLLVVIILIPKSWKKK